MPKANLKTLQTAVLWVTITFGFFQTVDAQQRPNWLNDYPANPLYYTGVGGIDKNESETDYQAKARDLALSELISQIEVNVSSVTETLEKEINGNYENSFSAMIQLQARKTIEDYEIVDSWENNKEYWVYLRLSKEQYKIRLQEKIERAQEQAYNAFLDGEQAFEQGNYASALAFFVRGLADVSPYLDRLSAVEHNGEQVNLFGKLRSSIQSSIDRITIAETTGPEVVRIAQPASLPFSAKVVSKMETKPMDGLPFHFEFLRGDGVMEKEVVTAADGVAQTRLTKLLAEDKLQIVTARLMLKDFLNEEASNEFLVSLLNSFTVPETRFVFRAGGRPVFLELNETYLGEQKQTNYIQPVLKNYFNENNYVFTDDMGEAELFVELEAHAKQGSETSGFYSVFLDYKVSITSLMSGEEIATYSLSNIKGVSISYEKAAASAYKTAIDSLEAHLIPRLFSQLDNK